MKTVLSVIFYFFLAGFAVAQTVPPAPAASAQPQKTAVQEQPETETYNSIKIPHSERTKDNFADIGLDFLLTKLFAQFENVTVSYSFLETSFRNSYVTLTDFKVNSTKPNIKGTVEIKTLYIGLNELLSFLKTNTLILSDVDIGGLKVDLTGYNDKSEPMHHAIASAEKIKLKEVTLYADKPSAPGQEKKDLFIKTADLQKAKADFTIDKEKYQASSLQASDLLIKTEGKFAVSFSSASANGKEFKTFDELKAALKK